MSPFAISGHVWFRKAWVRDYPPEDILSHLSEGKLVLVREKPGIRSWPQSTESKESIETWDQEKHDTETKKFFDSDRDATGNLFVRARVSNDAVTCLSIKAGQLLDMLSQLAKEGNRKAAKELVALTKTCCGNLQSLTKSKPGLLRPIARIAASWPVLKSPHPFLGDDHETALKTLQVGKEAPVEVDPSARWKYDAGGRIALDLFCYIWGSQTAQRRPSLNYGKLGELADTLPAFTEDTADKWWEVAKEIFHCSYPEPERVRELSALVTAPSHRKSPGRIRCRIQTVLKDRFSALAPPYPT